VGSFPARAFDGSKVTIRKLFDKAFSEQKSKDRQAEFLFSAEDILDAEVESAVQINERYESVVKLFETARRSEEYRLFPFYGERSRRLCCDKHARSIRFPKNGGLL
jgi:hypothetical protein